MAAIGQDRDDPLEAKVFRQHYAQLVETIQDPEALADGLFSRNVIGRGLLQEMQLDSLTKMKKSRKLLLAVQDQLVVNPSNFTEVVEVLQGDHTMKLSVDKLRDAYRKCLALHSYYLIPKLSLPAFYHAESQKTAGRGKWRIRLHVCLFQSIYIYCFPACIQC